jgi:hypothetical protein
VALQAEQVDVAQFQHVGIWSTVRQVARLASIDLYGRMLEHKRPLLVRVTLEADRILRGGSLHLLGLDCAVRIVTVGALDQPFVHPMMERHVELGFLLEMAREAKLGLRFLQEELIRLRVVRGVAGDATHIAGRVNRVDRIHVLRTARVAGEAAVVDLLGRVIVKDENLGDVPTALDVS